LLGLVRRRHALAARYAQQPQGEWFQEIKRAIPEIIVAVTHSHSVDGDAAKPSFS
jgi:hypothetical protein